MAEDFSFRVTATKGHARAGEMITPHGKVQTPVFMPVGTQASVKSLSPDDLTQVGAQILLANTYHLYLRPGNSLIAELGGLHGFMRWNGPILTDSGGYQVSSLGHFLEGRMIGEQKLKRSVIDEDGVLFYSHLDGSKHRLTAEKAIEIQEDLGADIIMAFDEATPDRGKKYAVAAMKRTHRWLDRSIATWRDLEEKKKFGRAGIAGLPQALFGIVQGGNYRDLRRESAQFVLSRNLPGIAIGGASIGRNRAETEENLSWIRDILPADKPIYLMGVGVEPEDLISMFWAGADMCDCVAPTRLARTGQLYQGKVIFRETGRKILARPQFVSEFPRGRFAISNERFKRDRGVIDEACGCLTCQSGFSRAYLRHLFVSKELLFYRLASLHNVYCMVRVMREIHQKMGEI